MQVESTNPNRPLLFSTSEGKSLVASDQCRIPFDSYMIESSAPSLELLHIDLEEASSKESQSDDEIPDETMQEWFPQIARETPVPQLKIVSDNIVSSPSSEMATQLNALPLPVSRDESDPLTMVDQADLISVPEEAGHFPSSTEVTEPQSKVHQYIKKGAEGRKESEVIFSLPPSTHARSSHRRPGNAQFGELEAAFMATGYQSSTSKIIAGLTSNQRTVPDTLEIPKQFPSVSQPKGEHDTESILTEFSDQSESESIESPTIVKTRGMSRFISVAEESLIEELGGEGALTEKNIPAPSTPAHLSFIDLIASSNPITERSLQLPIPQLTSPQHIPRIADQMFAHLNKISDSATSLELSPEELGTLRFNITPGERLSIQVFVERPETMELIRRHLDLFNKELRDMGFGNSEFTFTEHHHSPSHEQHEKMNIQDPEDQSVSVVQSSPSPTLALSTGRLDLKL